jgi:plasmid stabilization system protein ParE
VKGFAFLHEARDEMIEAAERYEGERAGLGADFLGEVQRVVDAARAHPESGTPLVRRARRLLLKRFPYSLVFRDEPEYILVIAVAHHRRRSGYWSRRK